MILTETNSFYNNELIGAISILSVLKYCDNIEFAKSLIIIPLFSYDGVIRFLKNKKTIAKSIYEFILKNNLGIANINKRFYEHLQLSVNSIFLLKELQFIEIINDNIVYSGDEFDLTNEALGDHAKDVITASKKLADILKKEDASDIYLSLRIEI